MSRLKGHLKLLDWVIYREEQAAKRLRSAHEAHASPHPQESAQPADLEALLDHLCDDDEHARHELIELLGNMDEETAIEALVRQIECNNLTVRWGAMNSLIHKGRSSVRPLLEALTRDMHSTNLREGAHHVLHHLKQQGYLHHHEDHVLQALEKHKPAIEIAQKANHALIQAM